MVSTPATKSKQIALELITPSKLQPYGDQIYEAIGLKDLKRPLICPICRGDYHSPRMPNIGRCWTILVRTPRLWPLNVWTMWDLTLTSLLIIMEFDPPVVRI